MSQLQVQNVKQPEFAAEAIYELGRLTAVLTGNADLRSKDTLLMFIGALHGDAARLKLDEVTVDFRNLQFMNSSCFKSFVSWITSMQEMAAPDQYKIKFLSNPTMQWQRRSLHALTCLASDHVSVQSQ